MQKNEISIPYLLQICAMKGMSYKGVCVGFYGDLIKLWLKRGREKRFSSRVGEWDRVVPSLLPSII